MPGAMRRVLFPLGGTGAASGIIPPPVLGTGAGAFGLGGLAAGGAGLPPTALTLDGGTATAVTLAGTLETLLVWSLHRCPYFFPNRVFLSLRRWRRRAGITRRRRWSGWWRAMLLTCPPEVPSL